MMEKNIALFENTNLSEQLQQIANAVRMPVEQLRNYYSKVLERELNLHQTWLLVNAQAAFFFAVMPVASPLLLRAACCLWFLHAVVKCGREL